MKSMTMMLPLYSPLKGQLLSNLNHTLPTETPNAPLPPKYENVV
jgi:hypothetical protein